MDKRGSSRGLARVTCLVYIISEDTSIFAPQRLPFYKAREPPRVPSKRYELRPCLCVFVACFDRRFFFTIRQKRIRGGRTYADCNSGSLKERRVCIYEYPHCASATCRLALDNRTYSAQLANATHTLKERQRTEDGREGTS